LNYALIPAFSFIGTSAAKVATEALGSVLGVAWLAVLGYRLPLFKLILRPLAGAAAVGLFIFHFSKLHLLAIIPAATLIYVAVEVLVGAFNKEDIALIKSCFYTKKEVACGDH
jgi:O-antigen/teichoic acid export membrane protein